MQGNQDDEGLKPVTWRIHQRKWRWNYPGSEKTQGDVLAVFKYLKDSYVEEILGLFVFGSRGQNQEQWV